MMAPSDDLKASIKVCMFDQYGTVVDMQTGLTEAAAPFLAAKGWQGDPNSFVTWLQHPPHPYRRCSLCMDLLRKRCCRRPGIRRVRRISRTLLPPQALTGSLP